MKEDLLSFCLAHPASIHADADARRFVLRMYVIAASGFSCLALRAAMSASPASIVIA
jgi:hypothetical protein